MAISSTVQLRAILVKNWRLQKRHRGDLFREIVWPVLLLMVLVSIRSAVKNQSYDAQLDYDRRSIATSWRDLSLPNTFQNASEVLFAPCTGDAGDSVWTVAQQLADSFGIVPRCLPCDTDDQCGRSVDAYYAANQTSVFGAVVFTSDGKTLLSKGSAVTYYIRMDGDDFVSGVDGTTTTKWWHTQPNPTTLHYNAYFLPLQAAVERVIIHLRNADAVAQAYTLGVKQVGHRCGAVAPQPPRSLGYFPHGPPQRARDVRSYISFVVVALWVSGAVLCRRAVAAV